MATALPVETAPIEDLAGRVLRFRGGQTLPPTPPNYTLGYLVLTNGDGLAARAVDALILAGARVSQADADRILAAHGPQQADARADEAQAKVRLQTLHLAELAAGAAESAGEMGRVLAKGRDGLGEAPTPITAIVETMIARVDETERQLADATQRIETLRAEVESARGDAARDALTGLANRRGVEARLGALKRGEQAAIAICDIDRFKSVNDRYGHTVGDRVLRLVAQSLAENCAPHLVARWGGEEFLILIEGEDAARAAEIVDAARIDLGQRNVKLRTTDEPLGAITFSAGVAMLAGTADQTIAEADTRLYRAKAEGRDRVI